MKSNKTLQKPHGLSHKHIVMFLEAVNRYFLTYLCRCFNENVKNSVNLQLPSV